MLQFEVPIGVLSDIYMDAAGIPIGEAYAKLQNEAAAAQILRDRHG